VGSYGALIMHRDVTGQERFWGLRRDHSHHLRLQCPVQAKCLDLFLYNIPLYTRQRFLKCPVCAESSPINWGKAPRPTLQSPYFAAAWFYLVLLVWMAWFFGSPPEIHPDISCNFCRFREFIKNIKMQWNKKRGMWPSITRIGTIISVIFVVVLCWLCKYMYI